MSPELPHGVHEIVMPLGERISRLFVFRGPRQAVLFDTGCAGDVQQHLLPFLAEHGIARDTVRWAVVSHCDVDHFGGLADVAETLPEARRAAHALDAPIVSDVEVYLSDRAREFREPHGIDESDDAIAWTRSAARAAPLDILLAGGERIDLGDREIEILHVPGHSRGHLAIWDPSTGALAISDAALGAYVPFADGSPSFPPTYRYVNSYRETIDLISALPFTALLTAHYPRIDLAGDRLLLQQSLDFTRRADEAILAVLPRRGPGMTLEELLLELNPTLGEWPQAGRIAALAAPVMGHLEQLGADGAVTMAADAGRPTWTAP